MALHSFDRTNIHCYLGMQFLSFDHRCVHTNCRAFQWPQEPRHYNRFHFMLFHSVHRKLFSNWTYIFDWVPYSVADLINHPLIDPLNWIVEKSKAIPDRKCFIIRANAIECDLYQNCLPIQWWLCESNTSAAFHYRMIPYIRILKLYDIYEVEWSLIFLACCTKSVWHKW